MTPSAILIHDTAFDEHYNNDLNSAINEISITQTEASYLIGHIHNHKVTRDKRSILPFGGLFSFLFGTVDHTDVNSLKADVIQLYQNQLNETNVLNYIIMITNISRGLINENILKINQITGTIFSINETIDTMLVQ